MAKSNQLLTDEQVRQTLHVGLEKQFNNQRVLVLIPDHTRTIPLPFLFRTLVDILQGVKQLDFMVALGTHPPLSKSELNRLVGINEEERTGIFGRIVLLNLAWDSATTLTNIGTLPQAQIKEIAGGRWHPTLGGFVIPTTHHLGGQAVPAGLVTSAADV